MHKAFHKAIKAGAWVILAVFAFMVIFSMVAGCSMFQERKAVDFDCAVACKKCEDFKMHCSSEMGMETEGEDQGVNIINDLGGLK